MSLKQEIETWVLALKHYDANEFNEALEQFDIIGDTSKIFFNIGVIHATLGEHEKAVEAYQRAVRLDVYFAVAYFQQGVSNFLLGDFEEALANFNDALLYLRGNTLIDYDQLGLKFRLYSCEVLFNRGLCYMYLSQSEAGMQDFMYAVKEKQVEDHNVIDEAIADRAEGYTVFSIPVGIVYRPSDAKVRNVKQKDYLGKARLVAAADANNTFTGFAGTESKKPIEVMDDRPSDAVSFAASNLVIPNKTSKKTEAVVTGRAGNEVQVFPPTPPPEREPGVNRLRDTGSTFPVKQPPTRSASTASNTDRSGGGGASRQNSRREPARDRRRRDEMEEVPEEEQDEYAPPRRSGTTRSDRGYQGSRQPSTRNAQSSTGGSRRRRNEEIPEDDENYDDFYEYYGSEHSGRSGHSRKPSGGGGGSRRGQGSRRQQYNDDYQSEGDEDFDDDEEFELVSARGSGRAGSSRKTTDVKKIKVKIHAEDMRLIMIAPNVGFNEFSLRLKEKMGMIGQCKFKVKDEDGEMILVADQEDLDMAISMSKKAAKRAKSETGKMEIWVFESL